MTQQFIEFLGYLASAIVLFSVLMNSILKLRIFNLIGATLFAIYGAIIHAIPVAFVNGAIALINVYYLVKLLTVKELFKTLEVRGDNKYLKEFLEFYSKDIKRYFPKFEYNPEKNRFSFFILRNMNVAGIFMARKFSDDTLLITLDFATPEYRDFKVGRYVYTQYVKHFTEQGFNKLITYFSPDKSHRRYLHKMGFKPQMIDGEKYFVKNLK